MTAPAGHIGGRHVAVARSGSSSTQKQAPDRLLEPGRVCFRLVLCQVLNKVG